MQSLGSAGGEDAFTKASSSEFWIGNRMGGWASGTISCANTRKYHALFAAAPQCPEQVFILLAKMEEALITSGERHELSTNFYPGAIHPHGHKHISRFSFDGAVARWTFTAAHRRLSKEVWCAHGKNATHIRYTLLEGEPCGLEAIPLVSGRAAHSIGMPEFGKDANFAKISEREITFMEPVHWGISADSGHLRSSHDFYKNLQYPLERERQEKFEEDLLAPGKFEFMLKEGHHATITAATFSQFGHSGAEPEMASQRLDRIVSDFRSYSKISRNSHLESLVRASDMFIVRDNSGYNIVAGYPYFGRWARDAMISIPGLCVYTGRHALAREIIENWLSFEQSGLIPNRFDEAANPIYESSDGILYMMWALGELDREGGLSAQYLMKIWPRIRSSLRAWIGSNSRVSVDGDGLVSLKYPRDTWMDAQVDGQAVTPRAGKRVEINALWVHALSNAAKWGVRAGDSNSANLFDEAAYVARNSFSKFFNQYHRCLDDGIDPMDASMRPNALWAIALPNVGLSPIQQREAFSAIKASLLAPGMGLRTLAEDDKKYHPSYSGSQRERDFAYHQGAIWPYLLGIFVEAHLRAYPARPHDAQKALAGLLESRAGPLYGLPELFNPADGKPAGAPIQAWSVAEAIRASVMLERSAALSMHGMPRGGIRGMHSLR